MNVGDTTTEILAYKFGAEMQLLTLSNKYN